MLKMIFKDLRISPLRNILTSISMLVGIIAMIGSFLVGTLGKDYLISVNAQMYGWTPTYSYSITDSDFQDSIKMEEFFYKIREIDDCVEAMKRQAGRPSKENSVPVAQNYEGKTSRELLGEQVGESQDQVRRYIRLTNLVPELLDLVDEGKIKMRPAVELSYLDEDSQRAVVDEIDLNQCTPSHDQTIRMRKFFTDGKLTPEVVSAIMSEEKPNQREKIVLRGDKVRSLIPKNIPVSQTEDYVVKALEHYSRFLRQRAERDSR